MQAPIKTDSSPHNSEGGFSLIELLVGLFVMAEVLIVVLLLFDVNQRVASVQTAVADMQQSQRVVHHDISRFARMAGRGGLPRNIAIDIEQGVADETPIGTGSTAAIALGGTDVLTVRGVFSTPIYQVNSVDATTFVHDTGTGDGTVTVSSISPAGIPQDLQALKDLDDGSGTIEPQAMVLTSPVDDAIFTIVAITNMTILNPGTPTEAIQLSFSSVPNSSTENQAYMELAGFVTNPPAAAAWPAQLTSVAFLGLVEEYKYYIRKGYAGEQINYGNSLPADQDGAIDEGETDTDTEVQPKLTRAQLYPNTDTPVGNNITNLVVDIADNISDLQISMGVDLDNDGTINDGSAVATDADEWLYNDPADDPSGPGWFDPNLNVHYLRISTVASSQSPEGNYVAPPISFVENHGYGASGNGEGAIPSDETERLARMVRRRLLSSQVDLRNQG